MQEGGQVSAEADKMIRRVTLFLTPVIVVHCLLVMGGVIYSTHYTNATTAAIIATIWLMFSLYHYFVPMTTRLTPVLRFIGFQALALATILLVTGSFQPFIVAFVLLFLAAQTYFGYRGFVISLVTTLLAIAMDTLLRVAFQPEIVGLNLMSAVAVLITALTIIFILGAQDNRAKALLKSRRLEHLQYDRLLTIMNNLADAIFSTDSHGRVQLYNAACLNLLDTNESLKGKPIESLFRLTDKDGKTVNLFDLLKETERTTLRDDLRHTYPDGEEIRIELTFAPIKSSFGLSKKTAPHENGYILIARDITKAKSLEEERDEFISVVSHELRTPITIVEGTLSNLQVLMNQPAAPDAKLLASTIETAHDQTLYLAKMVNDLSTLSRAERGVADTPEKIDVAEMIHNLYRQYEKQASAKKLRLNIDLAPKLGTVYASRLYTEELLQNFITNAIKYTQAGTVTITVTRKNDTITFAVKDSGIGISRSDQTKIFQKFYRSEDYRIRETNGTGLGLYVSAKLAHKLGTHITLSSRLNHGSTFSFSLPASDTAK